MSKGPVYPSAHLSARLCFDPIYLSAYLRIDQSTTATYPSMSLYLSIYSTHPPIHLSSLLSTYLRILSYRILHSPSICSTTTYQPIYPPTYLSLRPSVYISISLCLSVSLSLFLSFSLSPIPAMAVHPAGAPKSRSKTEVTWWEANRILSTLDHTRSAFPTQLLSLPRQLPCLSYYLSICLPIYLSVYLSICLLFYLSIYLPVCLSLSVSLSVCPSGYVLIHIYIYT